ncbi:MAG: adenosylcobalamin-dependent ribonucleoside-diphosphate reductase [bacterium]
MKEKTLAYFNGDNLATDVWMNKYSLKDKNKNFLEQTPNDMHWRLAKKFNDIESNYPNTVTEGLSEYGKTRKKLTEEKIFNYFKNFKYISPQGSIMSLLGNNNVIGSLSNCVVIPRPYDSYGGIMYSDQQLAQLFKRRCGVGIDISSLRPKETSVTNAAGTSTGAVSFMHRYSNTTREVGQNNRRGALMVSIDVRHPDIFDFVKIKRDLDKVTGANISIQLRDDFMKSVENDDKYVLRFPVDSSIEDAKIIKEIKARDLWDEIIKSAHQSAEPGLIFKDKQHYYSTSSIYPNWKNISTNPCSEIAMNDDSCRLMVVNFFGCVENPFTKEANFNFDKLYEISYEGQRLIDDLVDLELDAVKKIINKIKSDPEPDYIKEIELDTWKNLYEKGKSGRRTGLGFTALGDTLAALGLRYDSDNAMIFINKIMERKFIGEFDSSIDMAIQRGKFKDFNPEYENKSEFVQMMKNEYPDLYNRMMKHGRRNISISTVAPTGSLSILTQTTSGIEPLFKIGYIRRRKLHSNEENIKPDFIDKSGDKWIENHVLHYRVKQWLNLNNINDYNVAYEKSPYVNSLADDIDWVKRVKIQSIVQKYITHSISSTINLPTDVSIDKVSKIYLESWKQGLKGITVYRDGSRDGVLISKSQKDENKLEEIFKDTHAPKRPKRLKGHIIRFQNNLEKWVGVVGLLNDRPYEIFTGKLENGLSNLPPHVKDCEIVKNIIEVEEENDLGDKIKVRKKRYDIEYVDNEGNEYCHTGVNHAFDPEYWNYAKLISSILRHGMPLIYVIELIESLNLNDAHLNTWKNGVLRVIKKYIKDGVKVSGKTCPNCGSDHLEFKEGCVTCMSCGNSKCS